MCWSIKINKWSPFRVFSAEYFCFDHGRCILCFSFIIERWAARIGHQVTVTRCVSIFLLHRPWVVLKGNKQPTKITGDNKRHVDILWCLSTWNLPEKHAICMDWNSRKSACKNYAVGPSSMLATQKRKKMAGKAGKRGPHYQQSGDHNHSIKTQNFIIHSNESMVTHQE